MEAPSCLRACSLCLSPAPPPGGYKLCSACRVRLYCGKDCQVQDWKQAGHKKWCGVPSSGAEHHEWCAYLHRNPAVTAQSLVETGRIKLASGAHCQLVTTGLNTCIFVVCKTAGGIIGWHASKESLFALSGEALIRQAFERAGAFESGFIIPGVDRDENLNLKPTCRTMREQPLLDPTESKRIILAVLSKFEWYGRLETLPPPRTYKTFVVCDSSHKRPYFFNDDSMFDRGCHFDAETAAAPPELSMTFSPAAAGFANLLARTHGLL